MKVEIRSRFKGNVDLSASSDVQQALIGAPVQLNAVLTPEPNAQTTYKWTSDANLGDQCNASSVCLAVFKSPNTGETYYTVNLEVRQGNQPPVTKSVKIKASLPTLTFSGTERVPLVTTSSNPCVVGIITGLQNLILGCPDTIPVTRNSIDDYGLYTKATATPPSGFISDGSTAYVEFRQLIKPSVKRFGRNVSECIVYDTPGQDGWREDFNGRESGLYNEFLLANFNLRSTFRNNATGTDASVVLEYLDSPGNPLNNTNDNNVTINKYIRDEQFETYVTYFAGLEDDENLGEQYRHALAVLPWKWNASAEKRSSAWQLYGIKFPKSVTQLTSQPKAFSLTSTGERAFSGTVRSDNERWEACSAKSPISTTTKRDVAVWRKNNGVWYVMNADGSIQAATHWGVDYDIPVPGDYDGDGKADFAVYRPDNPATVEDECQNGCNWYVLKSSDGNLLALQLGSRGDIAVPADYDGDGKADIAVFRPSDASWYALRSSDSTYFIITFGQNGDVPLPSDYDGDGFDDVAVWSPTNANWKILNSSNQLVTTQAWGLSSDKPVIGDYDGDGKTDIANWQSNGNWHILLSGNSQTLDVNFGLPATDKPVPGDYDGDGKTDIAVWRTNGTQAATWIILNSSNGQIQYQSWGTEGDIPIPAPYSRQ